jgi:hypothetical protein
MSSYTISAGDRGVYEKTLAADTEDTVTISAYLNGALEVKVLSGSAPVYFTVNGIAATVKGSHCYDVHPGTSAQLWNLALSYPAVIRLISSGSCVYSVSAVAVGVTA